MKIHEKYIKRCIDLAENCLGSTSPNPAVGSVIVYQNEIIGEGYTSTYGGNHAEVNAINSIKDKSLLSKSTIYVSLEPCNHFGKTPPCSELIVKYKIPNVVIGCIDPHDKVAGKGIKKLKESGCNVVVGVLEQECIDSNKRFFTYQIKKRPYIILKWAETKDGFIDVDRKIKEIENAKPNWITNIYSRQLVHKWRAEEDAILVGTNTVINDNPKLDVRDWVGKNPTRIILDRNLRIPLEYRIYNGAVKTMILSEKEGRKVDGVIYEKLDFSKDIMPQICEVLYKNKVMSVIVEGGKNTLESFINANLWDEARIFISCRNFNAGVKAPKISGNEESRLNIQSDLLKILKNSN